MKLSIKDNLLKVYQFAIFNNMIESSLKINSFLTYFSLVSFFFAGIQTYCGLDRLLQSPFIINA